MKFSEQWLRDWVNPSVDTQTLGDKLTALGLELDGISDLGQDKVIELGITPNRGDCLSILGVAREVSLGFGTPIQDPIYEEAPIHLNEMLPIDLQVPEYCPRYCGRIIRHTNGAAATPDWMQSRLEKAGMQSVNFLADVTNYVMLELGQPMHVFDLSKIKGGLHVRLSQGEKITLLNQSEVTLSENDLVICDEEGVIALAGVMGGLATAVSTDTKDIFLEAAYFTPEAISGRARRLGINSEGSQRWERGVDPTLAQRAMSRATQLITEQAGGQVAEVHELIHPDLMPKQKTISLTHDKLCSLLGMKLETQQVMNIFTDLNMQPSFSQGVYQVIAPSYRFDINLPEDLIEEVIRVVGYDQIPESPLPLVASPTPSETALSCSQIKNTLVSRGYHEVITYSFVDKAWQEILFPGEPTQDLLNPISPEMGSMRLSIWPGLLKTLSYNQNRQMHDLRIFEMGQCFKQASEIPAVPDLTSLPLDAEPVEMLAGLISGQCYPLHWGMPKRLADFFDLKGDLEALLGLTLVQDFSFEPANHSALAPGQTAAICLEGETIGWIGALHPFAAKALDVKGAVYLFEIKLANLLTRSLPQYQPLSKFPAIRRDLAVLVDVSVQADALLQVARAKAGKLLQRIDIFDVYQGERIEKGKKSIALGLILQDSSRTLIDEEVNDLMQAVVQGLEEAFQATVRE